MLLIACRWRRSEPVALAKPNTELTSHPLSRRSRALSPKFHHETHLDASVPPRESGKCHNTSKDVTSIIFFSEPSQGKPIVLLTHASRIVQRTESNADISSSLMASVCLKFIWESTWLAGEKRYELSSGL